MHRSRGAGRWTCPVASKTMDVTLSLRPIEDIYPYGGTFHLLHVRGLGRTFCGCLCGLLGHSWRHLFIQVITNDLCAQLCAGRREINSLSQPPTSRISLATGLVW